MGAPCNSMVMGWTKTSQTSSSFLSAILQLCRQCCAGWWILVPCSDVSQRSETGTGIRFCCLAQRRILWISQGITEICTNATVLKSIKAYIWLYPESTVRMLPKYCCQDMVLIACTENTGFIGGEKGKGHGISTCILLTARHCDYINMQQQRQGQMI